MARNPISDRLEELIDGIGDSRLRIAAGVEMVEHGREYLPSIGARRPLQEALEIISIARKWLDGEKEDDIARGEATSRCYVIQQEESDGAWAHYVAATQVGWMIGEYSRDYSAKERERASSERLLWIAAGVRDISRCESDHMTQAKEEEGVWQIALLERLTSERKAPDGNRLRRSTLAE